MKKGECPYIILRSGALCSFTAADLKRNTILKVLQ